MKSTIRLEPNHQKTVETEFVEIPTPPGLEAMRFVLHEAIDRGGYDVSEYRTGRVASVTRVELFPPVFLTREEAIQATTKNIALYADKLRKYYPRMKTVNTITSPSDGAQTQ